MAIELKNALAAWKKAKPITLTKTGVSEALRPLGANPVVVEDFNKVKLTLENAKKVLEVAVGNKHIQAHKAAHECVKQILESVNKQITANKKLREDLNSALKKIFDGGHNFLKQPAQTNLASIEKGLEDYNKLFKNYKPTKIEYAQVPTRVGLLAKTYLRDMKTGGKQFEGVKKEMTDYLKRYPSMTI